MAKPPKCRVCGTAHWSTQPHTKATTKEEATTSPRYPRGSGTPGEQGTTTTPGRARTEPLEHGRGGKRQGNQREDTEGRESKGEAKK